MIRTIFAYFLVALMGIVVQSSFFHGAFPSLVAPDFILLLVVCLAVREKNTISLFAAFLLGLLADFASGQFLGPHAAGSVLAYLGVVFIADKIFAERGFPLFIVAFTGSVLKTIAFLVLLGLYLPVEIMGFEKILKICLEGLVTAVFAGPVFWITSGRMISGSGSQKFPGSKKKYGIRGTA